MCVDEGEVGPHFSSITFSLHHEKKVAANNFFTSTLSNETKNPQLQN